MPRTSQIDILGLILKDLDYIIDNLKKELQTTKPLNDTPTNQALTPIVSNKTVLQLSDLSIALTGISKAIRTFSRVSTKDVDKVIATINRLSTSIKGFNLTENLLKGFNNMMDSMSKMNLTLGSLSDDLMGTFKKFNPIKGYMIGKALGSFYKNVIAGFSSKKLGELMNSLKQTNKLNSNSVAALNSTITALFDLDYKKLKKVSSRLEKLDPVGGWNFAHFITPIINLLKSLNKTQLEKIKTYAPIIVDILNDFTSLSLALILKLKLMGSLLTRKDAMHITNFINTLFKGIKGDTLKKAKAFSKVIKEMSIGLMAFTLSLIAITSLIILSDPKNIGMAFGILTGIIAITVGVVFVLSRSAVKDASKNALHNVASFILIVTGLTALLGITMLITKLAEPTTILKGFALLTAIVLISLGVVFALSRTSVKESSEKALVTVGIFLLLTAGLLGVITLSMLVLKKYSFKEVFNGFKLIGVIAAIAIGIMYILSRDKIRSNASASLKTVAVILLTVGGLALLALLMPDIAKNRKDTLIGMAVITGILTGMAIVLSLLKRISLKDALKGVAIAGLLGAVIISLTFASGKFIDLMQKIGNTSKKDILIGSAIVGAIIVATGAAMFAVSTLILGPQAIAFFAGFGAMETISLVILSISLAVSKFVDMLHKVNGLTVAEIESANNIITGGDNSVVGAISKIVSDLSVISGRAAVKVGIISATLFPVFWAISSFIDVILKMAKLEVLDSIDADGNHHYRKMQPEEFKDAAGAITTGFTEFINKLNESFNTGEDAKKMGLVLKTLRRGGIPKLMKAIGSFVDAILNMAQLKKIKDFKEDGTPIYEPFKDGDFVKAADALSTGFATFLTKLHGAFVNEANDNVKQMKQILKALKEGGVSDLMSGIGSFVDAIISLSSGKIAVEFDENGNPKRWEKFDKASFTAASEMLVTGFTTFINKLNGENGIPSVPKDLSEKIETITGNMLKMSNTIAEIISKDLVGNKANEHMQMLLTSSARLFGLVLATPEESESDKFKSSMTLAQGGIEHLINMINSLQKINSEVNFADLASAVKDNIYDILILLSPTAGESETFELVMANTASGIKKLRRQLYKFIRLTKAQTPGLLLSDLSNGYMDLMTIGKPENSQLSLQFYVSLYVTSKGLDIMTSSMKTFIPLMKKLRKDVIQAVPKEIDKLRDSLNELDEVIIDKDKERINAIQNMANKFNDVTKSITGLNMSMYESTRILHDYEMMEAYHRRSMYRNLGYVLNRSTDAQESIRETAIELKLQADRRREEMKDYGINIDTNLIANAIVNAMNDWMEQQKIINITFGENDARRIVGIMNS